MADIGMLNQMQNATRLCIWSSVKTGTIQRERYISAELVVRLGWRTIQNIFSLWEIIPFIDRRQECWNDGL